MTTCANCVRKDSDRGPETRKIRLPKVFKALFENSYGNFGITLQHYDANMIMHIFIQLKHVHTSVQRTPTPTAGFCNT